MRRRRAISKLYMMKVKIRNTKMQKYARKILGYLFDDNKAHEGHLRGQEESIEC